ncbi:HNH endonuclease [Shimia sp.]|uniref:HNH endonuclease n=1 Tax=Shimia sp. TaxID=1954381 RepID=UPI003BAA7B34
MINAYLKPVCWNSNQYKAPSGEHSSSGYPQENGYGHEEWNNSDKMLFFKDGIKYRAFHAEQSGIKATRNCTAFLVFISSHDGIQQMVGLAAKAISLEDDREERVKLSKDLKIYDLWESAWRQSSVQQKFNYDQKSFLDNWAENTEWTANWICPDDYFLWLDEPVTLSPEKISGKEKLVQRFGSHQNLDEHQMRTILNVIPEAQRPHKWATIVELVEALSEAKDLENIDKDQSLDETTKQALIAARKGQGGFRRKLEKRWDGKCAVSGCSVREVNRASHIVAWKDSDNRQRLDPSNGLLLAAHFDALFDKGLISFSSDGALLISSKISSDEINILNLAGNLREPLGEAEKGYLRLHRNAYGFPDG